MSVAVAPMYDSAKSAKTPCAVKVGSMASEDVTAVLLTFSTLENDFEIRLRADQALAVARALVAMANHIDGMDKTGGKL